jgi:hypothetical protein
MITDSHTRFVTIAFVLALTGCQASNVVQDYEADKARLSAKSGAFEPSRRAIAVPNSPPGSLTTTNNADAERRSAPAPYFGPNAVGTGTTAAPNPNVPFVDSAASCASILDADARMLCLQRAGQR